jgi:hypothetical protein
MITTAASKPLSLLGSVTAVGETVGAAVCEFTDVAADNIVAIRKRNLVIVSLLCCAVLFCSFFHFNDVVSVIYMLHSLSPDYQITEAYQLLNDDERVADCVVCNV